MKTILSRSLFTVIALAMLTGTALAAYDKYAGDTSIYGGATAAIQPNVLIVFDNSGSMNESIPVQVAVPDPITTTAGMTTVSGVTTIADWTSTSGASGYDPNVDYPQVHKCGSDADEVCNKNKIYRKSDSKAKKVDFNLSDVTTSCNSANPKNLLTTKGIYTGRKLKDDGSCSSDNEIQTYYTGNYLNWLFGAGGTIASLNLDPATALAQLKQSFADKMAALISPKPAYGVTYITVNKKKIDIAKEVMKDLVQTTFGVKFGLMRFHYVSSEGQGGELISAPITGTTTKYVTAVKNMDDEFVPGITNRTALTEAIDDLTPTNNTPLGEALFEAMRYFKGGATAFGNTVGVTGGNYTSPIESSCQKNYVIVVTDGAANADSDNVLKTIGTNGDTDADGKEPGSLNHILDDVAKYMYDNDLSSAFDGVQNVSTFTIGFGSVGADAAAVTLLQRTADNNHGHGQAYLATSQTQLASALTQVMSQVFSVDTSFVAPVVPVSPENRTYSSSRVYMGFFKPESGKYWDGNLKKYGLRSDNNITDKNGNVANWVDVDGDGFDDITGQSLPFGLKNGSFRSTSASFWSGSADAGDVNSGGAGGRLLAQVTAGTRKIYTKTMTGGTNNLTDTKNLVSDTNVHLTAADLGFTLAADKTKLINFLYGKDAYDENLNSDTTETRQWVFGDILHSKPLVINYATYTFTDANEVNCSTNKTMIFVGSNDGMLRAIRDCTGDEAWAFIPPEMLPNLQNIVSGSHEYFVDSSPSTYIFDKDKDGNIEPADGDKVILIVGMRRGGSPNAVPAKGAYHVIDVTIPESPVYLYKIDNSLAAFSELAEAWSEPKIGKVKIGTTDKVVAFIGAGYDNGNEDSRYGATQTFSGTGTVVDANSGSGNIVSAGTAAALTPKGRGIYAFEIATLDSTGVPTITTSATRTWGYVYGATTDEAAVPATNSGLTFSFPAEVAAVDSRSSGYTDRLYAVDAAANLWRFDISSNAVSSWTGKKIFTSNPGYDFNYGVDPYTVAVNATDVGRKVFYKPGVVFTRDYNVIYYGTGDREHPLNTNVLDRFYAVKDRGQTTAKNEGDLLDVSTDQLQAVAESATGGNSVAGFLGALSASTNYGWFIKLNLFSGEKVLAAPTIFNKVAYFTTFTPGSSSGLDPCQPSNLGVSRMYAVDAVTGEAVLNYDRANDNASYTNSRAAYYGSGGGRTAGSDFGGLAGVTGTLLRADRSKTLGQGIPSGIVMVINPGGQLKTLIGCGGAICPEDPKKGGSIVPMYWRQK